MLQRILPGSVEVREASAAADQLGGGAVLHHAAVVDHQHPVGGLHGGEAVRDDKRRPALVRRPRGSGRPGTRRSRRPFTAGIRGTAGAGRCLQQASQAGLDQPLRRDVQ